MLVLHRYLVRNFVPVVIVALAFFVLIIQLVDLFANLVRYLNSGAGMREIMSVQLLYLPKAISYAVPIALLFAVSFTLGSMYAANELIAVFGAGVPLRRFVIPVLLIGALASLGSFYFEERVVIATLAQKNELSRSLLNVSRSLSNTNVTVRGLDGRYVYSVEHYNDTTQRLSNVVIVERAADGTFVRRIDAASGRWEGRAWTLEDGVVYVGTQQIRAERFESFVDESINAPPQAFQRTVQNVDELRYEEAREWVRGLQNAGLPYRGPLTDYYKRFAFACTAFVVTFVSSAVGGRFRKNVLLLSLLVSLVSAVVYYVAGMVGGILAADGKVPPLIGAWSGVVLFILFGGVLFAGARN